MMIDTQAAPSTQNAPASMMTPGSGHSTRRRRATWGAAILGGVASLSVMAAMAPEPEPVARRWELQFEAGPMRVASVDVPDVGPRQYLYLTYHVVNNSGEDVFFAPSFDFSNGEGEVLRSGRDVPQAVTTRLLEVVNNAYIQDQVQVIGDILQGPQHAKDGLVIWPLNDMNPTEITVYVSGLSGESKTVSSPDGKDKFVVRKTLRLDFEAPGSLAGRKSQPLSQKNKGWIMR